MTSVFSLSGSLEESLVASNIALSANISGGEDSKAAKILLLEDSLDIASSMWRAWSPLPKNSYYSLRDLRAIKRVLKREIPLVVKANRASDILALIDLSKRKNIHVPRTRRLAKNGSYLEILGATGHNLKNINLKIPLGTFTCVTGVSGSGKSTLIINTLYNALNLMLNNNKSRKIPKAVSYTHLTLPTKA